MSRVGKRPIKVAQGAKVSYKAPVLDISGKAGALKLTVPHPLKVEVAGDEIRVSNPSDHHRSLHGLYRTLISNMIKGVTEGYTKRLELQGVGYRAQTKGDILNLSLGFSHPVDFKLPAGIKAAVEASTKITLTGADKDLLGVTAARIRKIRPPEPYKGKGIRYEGEVITLKQGKVAGK